MPELPELEVVREVLQRRVVGQTVTDVQVIPPGGLIVVRDATGGGLSAALAGQSLNKVIRRGKFLSFQFDGSKPEVYLLVNPKLTGRLQLAEAAVAAINGDFFWPWWYHTLFDYYPHDNDPTDVNGFAASRGTVYSDEKPDDPRPTLYLSQDNRAGIDQSIGAVYNAISGIPMIVEDGHISDQIKPDEYYAGVHPRTAIGLDRDRRVLLLFVVDGRQPNRPNQLAGALQNHAEYG